MTTKLTRRAVLAGVPAVALRWWQAEGRESILPALLAELYGASDS